MKPEKETMMTTQSKLAWLSACAGALLSACGGGAGSEGRESPTAAGGNLSTMQVLGNRADLVSGGQALVEVTLPAKAKASPADIRMLLNGQDVTNAFAVRADGRYVGRVEGLADGANTLIARVPNGPGARLSITNYPIGGPVISGAQVQPWVCTTKVANPSATNPDLGDPLDAQCNIAAPVVRYQYRTLTNSFAAYN